MTHEQFLESIRRLEEGGARFLSLSATELDNGEVELRCHFRQEEQVHTLSTITRESAAPSIAEWFPAAEASEAEAARRFQIRFISRQDGDVS